MAQWTQKWWPRSPQNFVRTVYPTSRGPKSFVRTENLRCRRRRSFLSGLSSKVAAIFEKFVRTPESYLLAAFSGDLFRNAEMAVCWSHDDKFRVRPPIKGAPPLRAHLIHLPSLTLHFAMQIFVKTLTGKTITL